MEKFIPARPGIDLGLGFNTLNGEARGVAVDGEIRESSLSGQEVGAEAKVVESQEQMNERLNVSVEASGHYGLFSAKGRFGLAQQSGYTAQSTYVIAKCTVENAFRSFARPKILEEAGKRLREEGPESFKVGYGDAFVRGMTNGGELYAVFQMTDTNIENQKRVAVNVQGQVQGLLAGGSVEVGVEQLKESKAKVSSMSVLFYQRAGTDDSISPVSRPEEIAQRLKDFPTIARRSPVGYLAQIMDYQVLALPSFDELGFRHRMEALEDYARLKVKLLGIRAEIDLVRRSPGLFVPDYSDDQLSSGYDLYTRAVNMLNRHARLVANREIEPSLFEAGTYDPELKNMPSFIFKKKAPEADFVQVPLVIGLPVNLAQETLRSHELNPLSDAIVVNEQSGATLDTVLKQAPVSGESLPKGTNVIISYNFVPSQRFSWTPRPREGMRVVR